MGRLPQLFFSLIALTIGLYCQHADAADTAHKRAEYTARALVIEHVAAQISVSNHSAQTITVIWSGPPKWVAALRPKVHQGTLVLNGSKLPATPGSTTAISAENVTVTASGGGSASVSFGSTTISNSDKPPTIDVLVPKDIDLTLTELVGTASIAPRLRPLTASMRSGSLLLEGLENGGFLSIPGSGNITVENAKGNLSLAISGSGDITLESANLSALKATISGNGMIAVHGQSHRADLSLSGSGMIEVEKVTEKPKQSITGAGMISIGNAE